MKDTTSISEKDIRTMREELEEIRRNVDTIAKSFAAYIDDMNTKFSYLTNKVDMLVKKIDETHAIVNDSSLKLSKDIDDEHNTTVGGFYELRARIEDIEENILLALKRKNKEDMKDG